MKDFSDIEFDDPVESVRIESSGTIYEGFIDTGREHIPFVARYNGDEMVVEIEPTFEAKYGMESIAEMREDIKTYLEENYS